MEQPIVLCGLGSVGWRLLAYLRAGGLPVVAVDNACAPDDPRLQGARLVRGDCRRQESLLAAGVTEARGVLIVTSDDLINISTALVVRNLHGEVRVVIRMYNQNLLDRLGKAVPNVVGLSVSSLTAPLLALTALAGQTLGTVRIDADPASKRQVAELTVRPGSPLTGLSVAQAAARHQAVPLAHLPVGRRYFLHDIDPNEPLRPGDRLVLCGEQRLLAPVLEQGGSEAVRDLRWAGIVRRIGRMLGRTFSEIDWSVKVCTLVLVLAILISTVVFRYGIGEPFARSVPKALYRTISLMATGAEMGDKDLPAGLQHEWPEIYISLLRIVGAVLLAAFTAIFTNYLIRARLSGALEVRRIPDGGHIVVCGLGAIGFRAVQELVRLGERVVVVEVAADNRFASTARRLGAAVITGDATVREVLRQAHSSTARAVLACTTNDLVNLEVALLARELCEQQRIVLSLTDTHLADMLREEANIQYALSIPALAAPAFVAALLGDRVHSVLLVEGRMLAVVNLAVRAEDAHLAGHTVAAVAVDQRLLPLALHATDDTPSARLMEAVLAPGDRLVGVIALPDLERMLRRERKAV